MDVVVVIFVICGSEGERQEEAKAEGWPEEGQEDGRFVAAVTENFNDGDVPIGDGPGEEVEFRSINVASEEGEEEVGGCSGEDVFGEIDVSNGPDVHRPLVVVRNVRKMIEWAPIVHEAMRVVKHGILDVGQEERIDERGQERQVKGECRRRFAERLMEGNVQGTREDDNKGTDPRSHAMCRRRQLSFALQPPTIVTKTSIRICHLRKEQCKGRITYCHHAHRSNVLTH